MHEQATLADLYASRERLHRRYLDACGDYNAARWAQRPDRAHCAEVMQAVRDQLAALDRAIDAALAS